MTPAAGFTRNVNEWLGVPSAKQRLFLRDKHRHSAYGGARGGGKSWAVRYKAIRLALRWPNIKILIVRRTFPELRNNHIDPMIGLLHGIARYNRQEKCFTFPNGATIHFGYCNNDGDVMQYQGAEYDIVFLDEATQLQESWIKHINLAVRGANDLPKRTYYTCNPGGASHGYIKRLFIDRDFTEAENPDDYGFVQALVTDNDALMEMQPEYLEELKNLPPKLRAAWLEGRWDVYEGQFFEDFRIEPDLDGCAKSGLTPDEAKKQHRWVHVIEPMDLNAGDRRGWSIFRSYDFGYSRPFSCAWWAMDYDGVLYRILELYGCTGEPNEGVKWTPDQQFQKIREIETTHQWLKGKQIRGVADPAIWDESGGESVADTAQKYQIYFEPGDHARIPGWMQCHYRLQFDENGYPRMYVFSNCKAFIRTVPQMMYSETIPEDLDTSMEDHVSDEWRYMCMSRPVAPMVKPEEKIPLSDPLDQHRR